MQENPIPESSAPARPRMPRAVWLALAAALVVVALLAVQRRGESRAPAGDVAHYVAQLEPGPSVALLELSPWSITSGPTAVAPAAALPWRIGARLVDVELAIASGDTAAARRLGRQLVTMLGQAGAPAAASEIYADAAALTAPGVARRREAERLLVQQLGEPVALGAWIEAARYASLQRRAPFFRLPDSHASMTRLRALGIASRETTAAVDRLAGSGSATASEWMALDDALREMIAAR